MATTHIVGRSTVSLKPIPVQALYVGFVRSPTSVGGIPYSLGLALVLISSHWMFDDPSCGWSFSSVIGSTGALFTYCFPRRTEWWPTRSYIHGTVILLNFRLLRRRCREPIVWQWCTHTSICWTVKPRFSSQKSLQGPFLILGELGTGLWWDIWTFRRSMCLG